MAVGDLTGQIIGCAMRVHQVLGPGFLESVYEQSLMIELRKLGLSCEHQCPLAVKYDGLVVGEFVVDVYVEHSVIVELKAVRELAAVHEVQLVNYLKATGCENGLLLNFGAVSLQMKRKFLKYRAHVAGHFVLPPPISCKSC